jgi:hypothetical protein
MLRASLGILLFAAIILGAQPGSPIHSSTIPAVAGPVVREEQRIVVNGVPEIWRLEWKSPPKPACGAVENSVAITCPCSGFAYGESGQLDLVRLVNNREIERFALTPFFKDAPTDERFAAVVQRWELQEKDGDVPDSKEFAEQVSLRPVVRIMRFADYNHDGMSAEFYLQTETLPCGKHSGIVIGVTPSNPKLHVFATALHPNKPLILQKTEWDSLLKQPQAGQTLDWGCGDHGSDTETDMELRATDGKIRGIRREYKCTEAGNRGMLISEKPF